VMDATNDSTGELILWAALEAGANTAHRGAAAPYLPEFPVLGVNG
jgi:hypothetical protein